MTDFEIPNESTDRGGDLIAAVEAYNEAVEDGLKIIHDDPEFLNAYAANYPDEATALSVKLQYYVLANNVNLGENSPIEKVSGSEFSGELVENLESLDIFIGEYERFINLAKTPEATAQEAPKTAKKIPEIQPNSMKACLEAELGKYSFPQGTKHLVVETKSSRVRPVVRTSVKDDVGTESFESYGGQAKAEFSHPKLPGVKLVLVQDEDKGVFFESDPSNIFGNSGFNFLESGMEEACQDVKLFFDALLMVKENNMVPDSAHPFGVYGLGLISFNGRKLELDGFVESDNESFAKLLNDEYGNLIKDFPQRQINEISQQREDAYNNIKDLILHWKELNPEAPRDPSNNLTVFENRFAKANLKYHVAQMNQTDGEDISDLERVYVNELKSIENDLWMAITPNSAPESTPPANPDTTPGASTAENTPSPTSAPATAPQPSSQSTTTAGSNGGAPAEQAPRPNRSGDLAPEASQATFRTRLTKNKDAAEKDLSKPSYELTDPDPSGVQQLTIHLPSPEDVRNSRITDFVGMEGVAIQKTEEELGEMTLVLLADEHGQKAGTEYTWKEGTWRNAQGERLKIYDGTKIKIQNPAPTVAPAVAAAALEDTPPPTTTSVAPDEKFDPEEFNWLALEDEVDMPDNRTDQEKVNSLLAEHQELLDEEAATPRDSKGQVAPYIRARYDSYQRRLAQFKSTISDQPALLTQLAKAEKETAQFLAENPEEEAAA